MRKGVRMRIRMRVRMRVRVRVRDMDWIGRRDRERYGER
jgi:hypothetical protein